MTCRKYLDATRYVYVYTEIFYQFEILKFISEFEFPLQNLNNWTEMNKIDLGRYTPEIRSAAE
jgi:hypothetical protein